jgi:NADH-quinone oxidoreductase subunit G
MVARGKAQSTERKTRKDETKRAATVPKLIIDDRETEVPEGTKVIEAAEQLGIMIPRFCYHPALGSVGACRLCAVIFLQGPVKGIQMSCMVDAQEGMVVSTTDEEVIDFRAQVIEWLMLNHPHDCPVCDEGGHCLLQEMTVGSGHWIRWYQGAKRTHRDQYLGPLIQHEMNRCVQCYRCSRFYQEYAGFRDLGVMGIGSRVYFGRYKEGTLESPFAGNLIDICPTGVYTDRPSRFKGRRWEYERSPSLCINCSLGCHTVVSARYREILRQEARFSRRVNGYFICDRGRYGFFYVNQVDRPRHGRVAERKASWEESVQAAVERLHQISKESGPTAVACVGSTRSSLETQAMLRRLCQRKGWQGPVYWMNPIEEGRVKRSVSRLDPEMAISLRELEGADFILVVGADPVNEAPMLALAMRQAQKEGAQVAVLDPRPISLPFDFEHLPIRPNVMDLCLGLLIKESIDRNAAEGLGQKAIQFYEQIPTDDHSALPDQEIITLLARNIRHCQRPVIVCGTGEAVPGTVPGLVADYGLLLKAMKKRAGLFYLLPGANAFGAALLSDAGASFEQILGNIENGNLRALILVEADPFWHFPDRQRLEQALENLHLLVVLDYIHSPVAQAADVFLPTLTLYEAGGIFVNQEGRGQMAYAAHRGGLPIAQISGPSHPPQSIGKQIPNGEARAAWQTLIELSADQMGLEQGGTRQGLTKWLEETQPVFRSLFSMDEVPEEGIRIHSGGGVDAHFAHGWAHHQKRDLESPEDLELIFAEWTFGTEELSSYSPHLQSVERKPCLFVHKEDASAMGIADGDRVGIRSGKGTVEVDVSVVDNMASGILVMPRHRKLAWQHLEKGRIQLRTNQIVKMPVREEGTIINDQ